MLTWILALAVTAQKPGAHQDEWVERNLASTPRCADVFAHAEEFRLQVLVSEPVVDPDGNVRLARHGHRVDREYVYPASAIKLLAAVAAVETLGEMAASDPRLCDTTPLAIWPLAAVEGEAVTQQEAPRPVTADPTNVDGGAITLRHEIRKLFLVSDNEAFNRLFDFVGPESLNRRMRAAGLSSVRVAHRLGTTSSVKGTPRLPRIDFLARDVAFTIAERDAAFDVGPNRFDGTKVGVAFAEGEHVTRSPMDCARKNSISLVDLQDALVKVVRRDVDLGTPRFTLTDDQARDLARVMAEYPGDSKNPRYERSSYPDDYGKFLLPGLLRVAPRETWRVENKIGRAYGFSIENAHVVHVPSGRDLFVTIALYTNADGILNDGVYEYESVADPFLADLGELLGRRLAPREPAK